MSTICLGRRRVHSAMAEWNITKKTTNDRMRSYEVRCNRRDRHEAKRALQTPAGGIPAQDEDGLSKNTSALQAQSNLLDSTTKTQNGMNHANDSNGNGTFTIGLLMSRQNGSPQSRFQARSG